MDELIKNYKLYRGSWIFSGAPDTAVKLTKAEFKRLLFNGGLMVRNHYDFDCSQNASFWFIMKDAFGGMDELTSKTRNCVRRANKTLSIKLIEKEDLLKNGGYDVELKAFEKYKIKSANPPTKEEFDKRINDCGEDYDYWGIFDVSKGKLAGFSINHIHDNICDYETFKALPEYLSWYYPFYGLIYEMNRYYLVEKKLRYVLDGARSITVHSNIQPFLVEKFKFRKAYCKLQIEYVWWLRILVCILYPFRTIIPIIKVKAILNMEANRRGKM